MKSPKKYILSSNRWLSESHGDKSTVRDIAVDHNKTPSKK